MKLTLCACEQIESSIYVARAVSAALLCAIVVAAFLGAPPAVAGEPEDRTQLTACVNKHMTADESAVMRRLLFFLMVDALQADSDLQGSLGAKRDGVVANAATLITRLAEQDCKDEVRALIADKPPDGAFKTIFDAMTKSTLTSVGPGMQKAGITMGLDIIKKLDSTTVADIQYVGPPTGAPAPGTASVNANRRLSRVAVSGVRLRLSFETSLNPDCSAMGKTVIRVLTKPAHGAAAIEDIKDFTSFEATNQRYHCNERKTPGAAIYYQSERGYTGPDSVSYEIIFPTGMRRQNDVDLTVN